jgi:hypothetical protein
MSEFWIAEGAEIGRPWRGDKEPKEFGPSGDDNYGNARLEEPSPQDKSIAPAFGLNPLDGLLCLTNRTQQTHPLLRLLQ